MTESARKEFDPLQEKNTEFLMETAQELEKAISRDAERSSSLGSDFLKDQMETSQQKSAAENEAKSLVDTVRVKAAEAYNYVAGVSGDGESRGFVGAMREKAAGAYNFVAEKVSEATHAVTGDSNKDPTKESGFSITSRVSAVVEAVKDKAIEVKSEVLK